MSPILDESVPSAFTVMDTTTLIDTVGILDILVSTLSLLKRSPASIHHLNGRNENTHGVKKRSCSLTTYYLIIHVASTQSPVLHPLASSRDLRRAALIKK